MSSDLKSKLQKTADREFNKVDSEKLKISFSYLDHTNSKFKYHGLDEDFYRNLFVCLQKIKNLTVKELKTQSLIAKDLNPKFINWDYNTITEKQFPASIDQEMCKECFEVRITKQGRIHGFVFSNIFYLVWVDPFHNLFPGIGELKDPNDYIKVIIDKSFVNQLTAEREELKKQINELKETCATYEEIFQNYDKKE